ncbi:hypothetical protein [Cupriavidus necator]
MTFEEAFSSVEYLPVRNRVLLGRFGNGDDTYWTSFDADAVDLLDGLVGANDIGDRIARTVEEFMDSDSVSAVVIMHISDTSHAVLVLGPSDLSSVAEMLSQGLKQVAAQYAH